MASSVSNMNTGSFANFLSRDYKKIFFDEFVNQPKEYTAVANVRSMDGAYERIGDAVGLGSLQQIREGQPIPYEAFQQGNSKLIYPEDFGLAIAITQNMADDDQTGIMRKAFSELGRAAALTRELKFWDLLNSGFVTTVRTGIDSAALFATHTLRSGAATEANYASSAGAFSYTTLQAALNAFDKHKDEKGNPCPLVPKLVIGPPDIRFDMETVLKSEYNPDNAMQQVNTVGNKGLQFMVGHYLSSTTAWFVLAAKADHDLQLINRKNLQLQSWDEPNKRIAVFQAAMRMTSHFTFWPGTYGNAGA